MTSALGQWSHRGDGTTAEMFAFPGERLLRKTDFEDDMVVTWTSSGRSCFRFDRQNCLSSVFNSDGTHTLYTRLISERAVLKVAASGVSILYYDPNGRLRAERDRQGTGSAYVLDCEGDLESLEHQGRRINIQWDTGRYLRSLSMAHEFRVVIKNYESLPVQLKLKDLRIPIEEALEFVPSFIWHWHINSPLQRLTDPSFKRQ